MESFYFGSVLNCFIVHLIQQKKVSEIKFLMWTACKMKFVAWHMLLLMQKGITEKQADEIIDFYRRRWF